MQRRVFTGVALALGTALLASTSAIAQDTPRMGVVVKIGGIPWFNAMEVGIQEQAAELGWDAWMVGPTSADPALQVRAVEDLIAQGSTPSAWCPTMPRCSSRSSPALASRGSSSSPTRARPGERRLELRDGLAVKGFGEAHAKLLAQTDGWRGRVRALRRLADRAAAQCLGRCGGRLSRGQLSRHDAGRRSLRRRRERRRQPQHRPRPDARAPRPQGLPRLRQPGPDRRRPRRRRAAQGRRDRRRRAVLAGPGPAAGA